MIQKGFFVFIAIFLFYFLFFFLDKTRVYGQDQNFSGESFAKSATGTRAISMSESFVAVADDSSGIFHNPAGIQQLSWSYLSFHGQKIPFDRYATQISLLFPSIGPSGKLGLAVSSRFLIPKKKANTPPFDGKSGTSNQYSFLQSLSFAWNFNDSFSLGTNLKFIHQKMPVVSSYAGGMDLGALYHLSILNFGFFIQDLFTLETQSQKLSKKIHYYDPIIKMGIATDLSPTNNWKISIQLDKNLKQDSHAIFRIGGYIKLWEEDQNIQNTAEEFNPSVSSFPKTVYLNFGYGDKKISAGFSLQIRRIKLDFAFRLPELKWSKTELLFTLDILLF